MSLHSILLAHRMMAACLQLGSIMVLGRGIRVIGATNKKQFLALLNPSTLKTDEENGIRVRLEHLHAALRQHAGIDGHDFSKKFPLDQPEEELLRGF